MAVSRCGWATNDPLYIAYHDREWGSPLHDDRGLFELLILEGAQAGLSWITILRIQFPPAKSRANFRFLSGGVPSEKGATNRLTAPAYWKFESISLQRRVCKLSFPRALPRSNTQ